MSNAANVSIRRFEYVEGNASKFWQISVQGTEVTVRFGRIGSHGQTNTKSFLEAAAATKFATRIVLEKLNKGYTEVP